MWARAEADVAPRQHLWGVDRLSAAGHRVTIAPFHEPSERHPLERLSAHARGLGGHLDQELFAAWRWRRFDLLYCADQTGLAGLGRARGLGLRPGLISVVHHSPGHPARRRALVDQDLLLGLSERVCEELGGGPADVVQVRWGPDLDCPLYRSRGEGSGVVSAGKSNRDLGTLARAVRECRADGVIYDLEGSLADGAAGPGGRVVRAGEGAGVDPDARGGFTVARATDDLAAAAIVAIPVKDPRRLTGLTEAADALALAKPMVVTRSAYFPFDVERVGCGIWVEPGDVAGWRTAIAELLADPDRRREMGALGRRFAERGCNYATFCADLLGGLEAIRR